MFFPREFHQTPSFPTYIQYQVLTLHTTYQKMSSGRCKLQRVDSLFKSDYVHDSSTVPKNTPNTPSSASNNHSTTAAANTTADRFSCIQSPHMRIFNNVSNNKLNTPYSTTTGRHLPPTNRLPLAHHVYSIANSPSTSIPKNSNQNHSHQSCNTLTHPNQLFSAPYRPPLPSLHIPAAQNSLLSFYNQQSHNPRLSPYTQRGRNPPPGLNTQRGQYPTELFTALLNHNECPGCAHERLWPRDFSTHHWAVCPVVEWRPMMWWRREKMMGRKV